MDPRSMIDECFISFLLDRLDRLPKEGAPNLISSIKISVTRLKKVCVLLSLSLHKVCITISQFPHLFHLFFSVSFHYRVFTTISIKYLGTGQNLQLLLAGKMELGMDLLGCSHHFWWLQRQGDLLNMKLSYA